MPLIYKFSDAVLDFQLSFNLSTQSGDATGCWILDSRYWIMVAPCTLHLFLDYGSRPLIKDCTFENNSAGIHGGAIYTITRASQLESTIANVENCVFTQNSSGKRGGAVMNFDNSYVNLSDCTFKENRCGTGGGAIATDFDADTTIKNCTFEGNSADHGENDIDKDDTGTVNT